MVNVEEKPRTTGLSRTESNQKRAITYLKGPFTDLSSLQSLGLLTKKGNHNHKSPLGVSCKH